MGTKNTVDEYKESALGRWSIKYSATVCSTVKLWNLFYILIIIELLNKTRVDEGNTTVYRALPTWKAHHWNDHHQCPLFTWSLNFFILSFVHFHARFQAFFLHLNFLKGYVIMKHRSLLVAVLMQLVRELDNTLNHFRSTRVNDVREVIMQSTARYETLDSQLI